MSDMLTAQEAAERLGISEGQALTYANAGLLPSYRFGREVRFDLADVTAFGRDLMKLRSPRILREAERLRHRIPEAQRPPSSLKSHEQALAAKRFRRLRMAPWADGRAIRAMYAEARRLTRETGSPYHVDHVIPLQGEFVSGLHVHTNLQILPGAENSRKRNKYEVNA